MKLKPTLLFGLGVTVILLFVSCQPKDNSIIATIPDVSATSITMSQSSSASTMTVPQPTVPKTVNVDTTSEPIPDFIVTPTIVPQSTTSIAVVPTFVAVTLTPLPTFAANELKIVVEDLLVNPMNCDVACWWGAIPGITTINDVKHALAPYNFDIYEYEVDGKIYLRLGIGRVEEQNGFEIKVVYSFSDSILTEVTAFAPSISDILAKYGQPDEVWLSAMNDPREQPPLIWFVIVYFREGIGIGYVVDGNVQDDVITGCVASEDTERLRNLRLLVPDSATEYKDFPNIFTEERLYLPLEEATNLTVGDFMQLFSDSGQPQCIETPAELWD